MSEVPVRPGVAERLARMIQLPTVSAQVGDREAAAFRAFPELVAAEYPHVARDLSLERVGELGLLYRWRGRSAEAPLVLMAHYDVVPAEDGDGWTHPPFAGHVADGRVHGRGALDDKGPLVVVLEAVENLLTAGFVPARDVYLSFGGDEESTGDAARAIVEHFRAGQVRPSLVVDEGGAVVDTPLPFVPGTAAMIGIAEKGVLTVALSTRSSGGHASAPPRTTATARLVRALGRLDPHPFPARTPPALREMLRTFVSHARGSSRALLRLLVAVPPVTAWVFARAGGERAAMVQTTLAVTMLDAGTAVNVLAPVARAHLNLRLAPGETVDGALKRLRRKVRDRQVTIELVAGTDPSPQSPVDGPGYAAVSDAVRLAYPEAVCAPYVMVQATDSRFIHRRVRDVFRFAPLRMTAQQRASIHGVDEYVDIESLERGERFYRALVVGLG